MIPSNGRVVMGPTSVAPPASMTYTIDDNPLMGQIEATQLSRSFFSVANTEVIQARLRQRVFKRTEEIIGPQSLADLRIVMRSVFLSHAKHQPTRIAEQVAELNEVVLEYAVENVASAVESFKYYKTDVEQQPMPLSHPVNMSDSGLKIPEIRHFI